MPHAGVSGILASGVVPSDWQSVPSIRDIEEYVAGSIGRRLLHCLSHNIFTKPVISISLWFVFLYLTVVYRMKVCAEC